MVSLVRFATVARRHLLRDHGHREKKGDERWGKSPSGEEKRRSAPRSSWQRERRNTSKRYISSGKPADEERKRAGSIYAWKAWAKPPLISENTRRISGLIRRRLTMPIRSSGFALARRSAEKKRETERIALINLRQRSSSRERWIIQRNRSRGINT